MPVSKAKTKGTDLFTENEQLRVNLRLENNPVITGKVGETSFGVTGSA